MARVNEPEAEQEEQSSSSSSSCWKRNHQSWKLYTFLGLLGLDMIYSILFMTPILLPRLYQEYEDVSWFGRKFWIYRSLLDLFLLSMARISMAVVALILSYLAGEPRKEYSFDLYHANGTKKSRDELEEEALEQSISSWIWNYTSRPSFACEFLSFVSMIMGMVKCLIRFYMEIGPMQDTVPMHPWLWITILVTCTCAILESWWVDSICILLSEWGHQRRQQQHSGSNSGGGGGGGGGTTITLLRHISSTLTIPLLTSDSLATTTTTTTSEDEEENTNHRVEGGTCSSTDNNTGIGQGVDNNNNTTNTNTNDNEHAPGISDIGGDANYKASWKDVLSFCKDDAPLIMIAFVFLLLAAAAQIYIPKYTGAILDALAETFSGDNNDDNHDNNTNDNDDHHKSISQVPGFVENVQKLILVSILGGVFSGFRGSIFTICGGRVNVRLRLQLMDSLLRQDIGFFDTTKTGDITSRLSSDTTLVGDQVMLNVNVFLRSMVQAIGVLVFMFIVSWQLSILAFISVPAITLLSKWYGAFIRNLTKVMQTKLAEGNSVSEAAISSMATVRAFDAAPTEYREFEICMEKYLDLNRKSAIAYSGYATVTSSLPQLVTAIVVFYGGLMVRNGDLSTGELVSFLLYLQSLSDAFSSIGYIFSSLTQAVGAADKVFELMNRKPRLKSPSSSGSSLSLSSPLPQRNAERHDCHQGRHVLNLNTSLTTIARTTGIEPETCRGEIVLDNVEMYYPARPQRRILNGLSLRVPPGKIAALVGQSGGGKSSVISLVQHLYEPSSGRVMIDGYDVHDISPRWLSRHISIVSQEPTLFARSIKRNIMYGLEGTDMEPSQEEIERVAKLANADSFIEKMPQKYETEVGERGVQLSGGQKQRIAIARALVRKPKVLLLDEATSALDAESEHMVQEAIDHMLAAGREKGGDSGMTVIIVAHRLSTIRNADIIFVVQDGMVVEQGNHSELIQNPNGPYSSLIRRQMHVQKKLEDRNE